MTHRLLATVLSASGEAGNSEGKIPPEAWMVGAGAFVVFLVLLFVVTRLNLDR